MKLWNTLGTASRYILAAVSCVCIAQFLLLLNVGTENAGRLAGQALGRGVVTGLVAAVWFYRARKVRPPAPANAQTQVQVTPPPKLQAQPAVPPMDSVSAASPTSVLAAGHSSSSFWEEHRGFVGLIAAVLVAIILCALATGMFQQSWTLSAGTSQPRFVHVQGAPPWKMFDNKTGQECNTEAVTYDSVDRIKRDMHSPVFNDQLDELKKKCDIERTWNCIGSVNLDTTTDSLITELLTGSKSGPCATSSDNLLGDLFKSPRCTYPQYKEFYDRYDAVIANPDKPPVYHYNGMPYCSELSKKWW